MAGPLVWTSSVTESQWHAVMRWDWCGARPVAVCGHIIPGKVHGRRDVEPPQDSGRSPCAACCAALKVEYVRMPGSAAAPSREPDATEVFEAREPEETARHLEIASALEQFPCWPSADPDTRASKKRPRHASWLAA